MATLSSMLHAGMNFDIFLVVIEFGCY